MIDSVVYDFTGYHRSHPGGEAVFERIIATGDPDCTEEWSISGHPKWVQGQLKPKRVGRLVNEEDDEIEEEEG